VLESKYALPNDQKINKGLLGDWMLENSGEDPSIFLQKATFVATSDLTYQLIIKDGDKTEKFECFTKTFDDVEILNIKIVYKGNATNAFYGYKVKDEVLTFFEVKERLNEKEFNSTDELVSYFEENINKEDFFMEKTKLVRL
jgi:hypothetical protein